MANIFFISDLHLGHKRIMEFGQRDFPSIEEHDEAVVAAWNSVVRVRDSVWVLGDVAMSIQALQNFDRMLGKKFLILGNHDKFDMREYMKHFDKIGVVEKRYGGMVMSHIPIHPQEMDNRNWNYNIHGHIHDPVKDLDDPQYFNVNADIIGMKPISLDDLRSRLP